MERFPRVNCVTLGLSRAECGRAGQRHQAGESAAARSAATIGSSFATKRSVGAAFDAAAVLLDEGYQQTENGYGALRDGGLQVSVRTTCPASPRRCGNGGSAGTAAIRGAHVSAQWRDGGGDGGYVATRKGMSLADRALRPIAARQLPYPRDPMNHLAGFLPALYIRFSDE